MMMIGKRNPGMTYSDVTSAGKLRGIIPALSHSALSLVHVQDGGQRGCLALLASTNSRRDATRTKPSHLPSIVRECAMLRGRAGASKHAVRSETDCLPSDWELVPLGARLLLPLPGGRRATALGCALLACLLRTGAGRKEKNKIIKHRRNPPPHPESAVITPPPGAHRPTCLCVIKEEKTGRQKKSPTNLIKLAPQWLRRAGKRQLARRTKAV